MKHKKTTLIATETIEVLIVKQTRRSPVWCEACSAEALMTAPDVAARINGTSARTIYAWVEAGKIHFAETAEGALLVCLNSLSSLKR